MDENEKVLDNSLESTMDMSQDDIEKLLLQYEEQGKTDESTIGDLDLQDLLAGFDNQDNGSIQDISELLSKSDQNQAVDEEVMALLKSQEEEGLTAYDAMDLFSGDSEVKKESFWSKLLGKLKKDKKEKVESLPKEKKQKKKEKKSKEKQHQKEKTQDWEEIEVQDEDIDSAQGNSMNDALALLTGNISDDNTSAKPAKEKKAKKNKKNAKGAEEEEVKEKTKKSKGKEKGKKEKNTEKKNKKENKEIREKVKEKATIADAILELEAMEEEPPHKKKIIMIFVASILIMLGFLVVNYYFTGHANKRLAEEAYEEQDYLECYQLLYGQRLNDSQRAMYKRSECILKTDIFWRDYHTYMEEEKWLEGLDELTQYVYQYPKRLEDAKEWNGQELVENTYNEVQGLLLEEYETDVEKVVQIAELKSDEDYTRALLAIVKEKEKREALNKKYPDMLPEEKDRLSQ